MGTKAKDASLKRKHKKSLAFNTLEMQALNKYCKKYKVANQSKLMRELIMSAVLKKFSDDYPTLWDQPGVAVQARLRF